MRTTDRALAAPGYRAAEAYVRPSPNAVAGDMTHYVFDLRSCTFNVSLRATKEPDQPSVFFLPEFHFPRDMCVVETSGGKWEIYADDGEVQRLRWWHGQGEQKLTVTGVVRQNLNQSGADEVRRGGEELGYYDSMNAFVAKGCVVM